MRGLLLLAVSCLALTRGQEEVNFGGGEVSNDSPASDPIPAEPGTFNTSDPKVIVYVIVSRAYLAFFHQSNPPGSLINRLNGFAERSVFESRITATLKAKMVEFNP